MQPPAVLAHSHEGGIRGLVRARAEWFVMLIAVVARLPGLASKPLWYDEAFAVLFSHTGPRAMAYGTLASQGGVAADVHPLGYYSLLWAWTGVLGDAIWAVRLLSVLLGLATVLVGLRLARDLLGEGTAIAAGLLLAGAPFQVHYSQEVRMYALMALLLLLATWAYFRAVAGGGLGYWALFALFSAAAQYTHTLSAFYLLPLAAIGLWRRRWRDLRNSVLAGAVAVGLYLPWLLYLPSQLSRVRWAYWVTQPGLAELIRTWLIFIAGLPVYRWALIVGLIGTVLATVLAVLGSLRAWQAGDQHAGRALWCLYLAAAPAALMFAASYWQPVYLDRALLASGLVFLLWLVWGITRPQLAPAYRRTAAAAIVLAAAAGLAGNYLYRGFPYAPFSELAAQMEQAAGRERMVHSNKISALPTAYYEQGRQLYYLADPPGSASDTLAPATQEVLGLPAQSDIEHAAAGADQIAFVVFERELQDYQDLGVGQHPALQWLAANYTLNSTEQLGDLMVFHYYR